MKDLQKDLKMIISTNISETEKDEWIEKLVNGYIDQQKALIIDSVSQQRELLKACFLALDEVNRDNATITDEDGFIDDIIQDFNCG